MILHQYGVFGGITGFKENSEYPDLILIDGGKGQLSMAISALELGLDYINIIGLYKKT